MITEAFEHLSKKMAGLIAEHQTKYGASDAEVVGALRLTAATIEARFTGGKVLHQIVVEVQPMDEEEDFGEEWKG
jgi:hypothetical protein